MLALVAVVPAPSSPTPTLTLDPPAVEFGEIGLDEQSEAVVVSLTVTGGPVADLSVVVEGPFVVDEDCDALADGETCEIAVRFVPVETGSAGGQLLVESGTASVTASLTGTGIGGATGTEPSDTPSPTTIVFPTIVSPTIVVPTIVVPTGVVSNTTLPGPTTPSSTPIETRAECDARALAAQITYTPSLEMRVGRSESITALASIGGDAPDSSVGGPPTVVVPQPLRCQVRARLIGGDDFGTNPADWQDGSFRGTTEISWRWVVTPRVAGDGLFLILEVQGLEFDPDAGVYKPAGDSFQEEARIRVNSRPRGVVSQVNDAVTGVVTHPLVAFAGAGGVVVLVRWVLQRRGRGPDETADPGPA